MLNLDLRPPVLCNYAILKLRYISNYCKDTVRSISSKLEIYFDEAWNISLYWIGMDFSFQILSWSKYWQTSQLPKLEEFPVIPTVICLTVKQIQSLWEMWCSRQTGPVNYQKQIKNIKWFAHKLWATIMTWIVFGRYIKLFWLVK